MDLGSNRAGGKDAHEFRPSRWIEGEVSKGEVMGPYANLSVLPLLSLLSSVDNLRTLTSLHWGQLQTHVKAACDKCMWSVLATRLTRWPLVFKGRLCGMLYAFMWGNKACKKATFCLSKAAL
jgi:hypothetical protein